MVRDVGNAQCVGRATPKRSRTDADAEPLRRLAPRQTDPRVGMVTTRRPRGHAAYRSRSRSRHSSAASPPTSSPLASQVRHPEGRSLSREPRQPACTAPPTWHSRARGRPAARAGGAPGARASRSTSRTRDWPAHTDQQRARSRYTSLSQPESARTTTPALRPAPLSIHRRSGARAQVRVLRGTSWVGRSDVSAKRKRAGSSRAIVRFDSRQRAATRDVSTRPP
jgi:hypothetical protein